MITTINLYYLLQYSVRFTTQKAWQPVGVSSLLIDRTKPGGPAGLGTDGFSALMDSLSSYLLTNFGNYTDLSSPLTSENLKYLKDSLDPPKESFSTIAATYDWLESSGVTFNINALDLGSHPSVPISDAAVFPMIPGLSVTYNGQTQNFGDAPAPAEYINKLKNYFARLSSASNNDGATDSRAAFGTHADLPASSSWFPGVVFADYFNLLAKQIYQELYKQVVTNVKTGTLAQNLALIDIGNLAGIATRFLQHGLRLPDPADPDDPPTMPLRALFDLTGQQFDVASDSSNWITGATIASASPKLAVTIAGTGAATLPFVLDAGPEQSPIWNPRPLDRIKNVPQSFMLRQGVPWTQAATNWQLFGFPDMLQADLRNSDTLNLKLTATTGDGTSKDASGMEGFLIRFQLAQVQQTNPPGPSSSIFQVFGTNEATRDLMEVLFDRADLSSMTVDLLLPADKGYRSVTKPGTLLVKTNLSSYSRPELAAFAAVESSPSDAGPTYAAITNATDFLRLLWECSVVHSGGFYLYVPPQTLQFPGSQARLDVALLVTSSTSQASSTVSVDAYHNVILVDASSISPNARLQADVFQDDGVTRVTVPQPNYPAGAIAFQATWTDSDTPPVPMKASAGDTSAFAATLYQLLQFQLQEGDNIDGSGWSTPLGPNGTSSMWEYRRAVPLYKFIKSGSQNRYAAIGQTVNVDFQLVDMFGNAFQPPKAQALSLTAVYNDELVPLDRWPAAGVAFSFQPAESGTATLELTVTFNPDQVSHAKTALPYYQLIQDQLSDEHSSLDVTTSLAARPVTIISKDGKDIKDIKTALGEFVTAIIAYLTAITKTPPDTSVSAPSRLILSGIVSTGYISQIEEDLFPVWVSVEMSRSAPPESPEYSYPDGFLRIVSQVPPLLSGDSDPAALRTWAVSFEEAFYNFDNQNALLKVAAGKPPTQISATRATLGMSAAGTVTSTPGDLWALKWSATAGVAVSFPNNGTVPKDEEKPIYFAPLPISTQLASGSVDIYGYDKNNGNKNQVVTSTQFTGIDLDGWARSFLQAFEGLLSPELATKIAQLDGESYDSLMAAKEQLANAISSKISWVLKNQMDTGVGDLDAAKDRFREGLLASLNVDFATSTIVQMPAVVSVQNTFDQDDTSSQSPDFFGNPSPSQGSKLDTKQYTVSTAPLPIKAGENGNPAYLNFLIGTVTPGLQSSLDLPFSYDIGFIDHRFQTSEEKFGYLPSSWLRFVVPDTDPNNGSHPALDVGMGRLEIPIPLRAYPSPPHLVRQTAEPMFANPVTITEALKWSYQLNLVPPSVAQDDIHIVILGNGANLDDSETAKAQDDPLFAPLARFQDFQINYLSTATDAIMQATTPPTWLSSVVSLVQEVAEAWQPKTEEQLAAENLAAASTVPAPFTWEFILQAKDARTLILQWNGSIPSQISWPVMQIEIAGKSPQRVTGAPVSESNPPQCEYDLPSVIDNLTLVWDDLPVIIYQSLSAAAWIERNEILTRQTNPTFVYSTQTVSFHDPVVPLLQAPSLALKDTQTVKDAVNQLVTQIMQPVTPETQVGCSLEAGYSFILVSSASNQLTTRLPILLANTTISTAASLPPGAETMQDFEDVLANALVIWHTNFHPSDLQSSLLFKVSLFASGNQQPLARLLQIEVPISGSAWWPASKRRKTRRQVVEV